MTQHKEEFAPEKLRSVVRREWIDALGLPPDEEPEPDVDFFELGGNSMQAIVMIDRIGTEIGAEPSVEALYLDGTLDALVEHCAGVLSGDVSAQ